MLRITVRRSVAFRRVTISTYRVSISCYVRSLSFAKVKNLFQLSDQVKKEIFTPANFVTASRIVASPLITVAIINDRKELAIIGFVFCCVTDWLDGKDFLCRDSSISNLSFLLRILSSNI